MGKKWLIDYEDTFKSHIIQKETKVEKIVAKN